MDEKHLRINNINHQQTSTNEYKILDHWMGIKSSGKCHNLIWLNNLLVTRVRASMQARADMSSPSDVGMPRSQWFNNLLVTRVRASMQARADMSSPRRCRDAPKSMMELIQSPNIASHCSRWSTTPLSKIIFSVVPVCNLQRGDFTIHWNCNILGLLHHPFWLYLVLALFSITSHILNFFLWLRITHEGSVPKIRMWSILLIKSDLYIVHVVNSIRF